MKMNHALFFSKLMFVTALIFSTPNLAYADIDPDLTVCSADVTLWDTSNTMISSKYVAVITVKTPIPPNNLHVSLVTNVQALGDVSTETTNTLQDALQFNPFIKDWCDAVKVVSSNQTNSFAVLPGFIKLNIPVPSITVYGH